MLRHNTIVNHKSARIIAWAWVVVACMTSILPPLAQAQFAEPLPPQNGDPLPPPTGDGPTPHPVISGDASPKKPPSGQADSTGGNMFASGSGQNHTLVHIFKQGTDRTGIPRGLREVQTLRPDQLSPDQINSINGILGVDMLSGQQNIKVTASSSQLEQIQNVLASYPGYTQQSDGRKKIVSNIRGQGYPKPGDQNMYVFDGLLPTVRYFAHYLVVLGVVCATVMMAMAATSVAFGHQYGGARVIGVAGGLIMLLMSYTIWKVVQMNTYKVNSTLSGVRNDRTAGAAVGDQFIGQTDVPQTPTSAPQRPQRSGVPLQPFGNAGNP